MRNQELYSEVSGPNWKSLYLTGGIAAMLAGVVFRRNLGAEIALFSEVKSPAAVSDWFMLLQTHRLLGLAYLGIFDILNYIFVGLMLLALFAALRRAYLGFLVIAAALGFLGIATYFSSNTALSMLSLSNQFAASNNDAQRTMLLAAGQSMLALNRFSSAGANPGSGGYLSLLLIAAAGLIFSTVLLRSNIFKKPAAYVGILANVLDLLYCIAFLFSPRAAGEQLAILFIPAAGLFFMIWHIMLGWGLLQQWRHFQGNEISDNMK